MSVFQVLLGFLLVLSLAQVEAGPASTVQELTKQSSQECLAQGGLCVVKSLCPAGKLSEKSGLCGNTGSECCHSLPTNIKDCEKRGGICMSGCGKGPKEPIGVCEAGKSCCVLI